MRLARHLVVISMLLASTVAGQGRQITAAGQPAQLDIRPAGDVSLRITLKPVSYRAEFPATPAVADRRYAAPALSLREITKPVQRTIGALQVDVRPNPLTVTVRNAGRLVQEVTFEADGTLSFKLDEHPVLGMGEGGPRPEQGTPWRQQPVQFDRRGKLDTMEPRWQSDMYGSRNPVAMLLGTRGWGLFVATPWVQVDLRDARARRLSAVAAALDRQRPADAAQPAAELGEGTAAREPDRRGPLRPVRLRRARSRNGPSRTSPPSPGPPRCRRSGRSATCSRIARSKTTRR